MRSGDYYMFDDFDDEDPTDIIPESDMDMEEDEQHRQSHGHGRRMTVSEVSK